MKGSFILEVDVHVDCFHKLLIILTGYNSRHDVVFRCCTEYPHDLHITVRTRGTYIIFSQYTSQNNSVKQYSGTSV